MYLFLEPLRAGPSHHGDHSMTDNRRPSFKRIIFKPSGEALAGDSGSGLDGATLDATAAEIIHLRQDLGVDVAVVVGGGNFWRGQEGSLTGMDATQSDHIGMLGTVMNALALQDALERQGQETRVQSAIEMPRIAEAYIRRRAVRHLEKGRVVIFAAGTGNPFFTTDTAAALRAAEIEADALIKGTHSGVDGIYSADPRTESSATKYDEVVVHGSDDQEPTRHGLHGDRVLPRKQHPDHRVRHVPKRFASEHRAGWPRGHPRTRVEEALLWPP